MKDNDENKDDFVNDFITMTLKILLIRNENSHWGCDVLHNRDCENDNVHNVCQRLG